jgi:hypothetical protein
MSLRCRIWLTLLLSLACLAVVVFLTLCGYPKHNSADGWLSQRLEPHYGGSVRGRRQSGVLLRPPLLLRASCVLRSSVSSLRYRRATLYREDYFVSTNTIPWVSMQVCGGRAYCLVLAFDSSVNQNDLRTLRDALEGTEVRIVEWPTAPAGRPPLLGIRD